MPQLMVRYFWLNHDVENIKGPRSCIEGSASHIQSPFLYDSTMFMNDRAGLHAVPLGLFHPSIRHFFLQTIRASTFLQPEIFDAGLIFTEEMDLIHT